MIEFNHVSKTYENGTHALHDVNVKIDKGEFVFVVGASGAGKSTFLKLLMREEVPSSGSIIVNKYNLGELSTRKIPYYRRTMGVVFQDFRLIPTMSVFDNVAFAMRVIGAKENKIRKRVPYVLNLVGLSAKARCFPDELSGGEQQRVALARSLANNAELIVADEPTGNVDPQMSYDIVNLLTRLNDGGTTVIMVTHEHELVSKFNRRVVILQEGYVKYDGPSAGGVKYLKESQKHLNKSHLDNFETHFAITDVTNGSDIGEVNAEPDKTVDVEFNQHKFLAEDDNGGVDFTVYLSDDDDASPDEKPAKAEKHKKKKGGDDK
ncbi:MAG: cell division ATP-binding protein FtsE [Clostridiales bacterium]|nr:cell division ATP-binding protein FtsE [Clostridiales bacterium]